MIDRFSGFLWVIQAKNESGDTLHKWLLSIFNSFGWPQFIRSDGGPQFQSYFENFCKQYNVIHNKTSVNNPQSNGLAESSVHTAKLLLKKTEHDNLNFEEALAAHRHVPRADGYSPFQLFFNRLGRLPHLPRLPAQFDKYEGMARRDETQLKQGQHFLMHARDYKMFQLGERVVFPDLLGRWTRYGTVIQIRPGGLSYLVQDQNRVYLRGRRFLRSASFADPPVTSPVTSRHDTCVPSEVSGDDSKGRPISNPHPVRKQTQPHQQRDLRQPTDRNGVSSRPYNLRPIKRPSYNAKRQT